MPLFGAHQSIAGGYHKAVLAARETGCEVVQLFTRNCSQWTPKPITDEQAARFRETLAATGIRHPLAHDCYLINLAAPDRGLWRKSIAAFLEELRRADILGIPCVVTHPGAFTTSSEAAGLKRIIAALDEIHAETDAAGAQCLLETTAGQGSSLGWKFEHLATILDGVRQPERLGVCLDTCHVFAAGYPLAAKKDYDATMGAFDRLIGLHRIKAFHLNDCRGKLGCRVDRHEHIGRGQIGLAAFRRIVNDPRFAATPMYLETPKGIENGKNLDIVNLRVLRGQRCKK